MATLTIFQNVDNQLIYGGNESYCGLQYSIYAGRHVVPGVIEGLLLECTADVNRVWSPLGVPRWSSTARLITKYLVKMIKVCFCSNNDGDY